MSLNLLKEVISVNVRGLMNVATDEHLIGDRAFTQLLLIIL